MGIALLSIMVLALTWKASLPTWTSRASAWLSANISTRWALTAALMATFLFGISIALRILLKNARALSLKREIARLRRGDPFQTLFDPSEQELVKQVAETRRKRIESRGVAISIIVVLSAGLGAGALVYATTPEVRDRPPSRSTQSVQSAALVSALLGGAVTIWLSNRRRRHDEATLEQGREELGLNRQRAEEERFTAAIELLGHSDSSVRVGALHVLHGLATTAPSRRQTVVDVMSAYLRQPFVHHSWNVVGVHPNSNKLGAADRELEVRRTALRLVVDLVKQRGARSMAILLVDLTGAHLDELDLEHAVLKLQAPGAHLHGDVNLRRARLHAAKFNGSIFDKEIDAKDAIFVRGADFAGCRFRALGIFNSTRFEQEAIFAGAQFANMALFKEATFSSGTDLTETMFEKYVTFEDSTFRAGVTMAEAKFKGISHFTGVTFRHLPAFRGAEFYGDSLFIRTEFEVGAGFQNCIFSGVADFGGARIPQGSSQWGLNFFEATFKNRVRLAEESRSLCYLDDAVFSDEKLRPKGADQTDPNF